MSNPFIAEIRIFTGNFAPNGWAFCDGQFLPISQNTALFSLLGTTYGGDGRTNFALPNLQGSAPMQAGQGAGLSLRDLGETGGEQAVSLLTTQMPVHNHPANAHIGSNGDQMSPAGNLWSMGHYGRQGAPMYSATPGPNQMSPFATSVVGGGQPHNNLMPYLTLNFIISLFGIYPSRS
jgi:microcystin-dependent protein